MTRPSALLLAGALALAPGCASFNDGLVSSIEEDAAKDYEWLREFYEVPLGMVGVPLVLALSPILYFIPAGDEGPGFALGRGMGHAVLFADPTENLSMDEETTETRTNP